MSGDIEMGQAAGLVDYDVTSINSTGGEGALLLSRFFDGNNNAGIDIGTEPKMSFDPLTATTSLKVLVYVHEIVVLLFSKLTVQMYIHGVQVIPLLIPLI